MQWLFHKFVDHLMEKICVAFIDNADCANRFFFEGHPSTSKFLVPPRLTERLSCGTDLYVPISFFLKNYIWWNNVIKKYFISTFSFMLFYITHCTYSNLGEFTLYLHCCIYFFSQMGMLSYYCGIELLDIEWEME